MLRGNLVSLALKASTIPVLEGQRAKASLLWYVTLKSYARYVDLMMKTENRPRDGPVI